MQTKKRETFVYSTLGVVMMLAILIAVNVITGALRQRLDLTENKAYTLSTGTRAILKKLDTPIKIRFYCTQAEEATQETVFLRKYAREVEDLLQEYKQVAGKNLVVEKLDPQPDSDAEDSARLDGLEPEPLPGVDRFYLGLSVNLADTHETIPFLQPAREQLLEYDITRAITRVASPQKPVVGIMSALPIFGTPSNPMMMQMGQQGSEPWAIVTELQADYTVRRVNLDADKIDDDLQVLLVVHPKDINDKAQYALDQFVLRGGKLIVFLDPFSIVDSQAQRGMPANMGGGSSNLERLLRAWGYQFDAGKVVADLNFKMRMPGRDGQPMDMPTYLAVDARGIDTNDVVTSQLGSVWLIQAGAFTGAPATGLKETTLLQSTKESQQVEGFLANLSGESVLRDFKASGANYKLALRLAGRFKTAFPEGRPEEKKDEPKPDDRKKPDEKAAEKKPDDSLKEGKADSAVVLVGDADLLYDPVMFQRLRTPFGDIRQVQNGNLNFVQNLVDQMAGDSNLVGIRSRAGQSRPFTRIKELEAAADLSFQRKIKQLQDSLADTQRRMNELQAQRKDKDQRFILSPEQRAELENFRKTEANVKTELKQVQKDLKKEVVSLQTRIKWINVLAMPLAVTATGIVIALVNRKKTSAK